MGGGVYTASRLRGLAAHQYAKGETGNAGGRPKTKPITDLMRALLAGDIETFRAAPRPLQIVVARWYGMSLDDPKALSLLLERVEGHVPKVEEQELPAIVVQVQSIVTNGHRVDASPGTGADFAPLPGSDLPVSSPEAEEVEVERLPEFDVRVSRPIEVEDDDDDES